MLEKLHLPTPLDGLVWMHAMPTSLHPRHHHAELELSLVVAGTGRYLVDDRSYELKPGTLIWLFPRQNHILLDMSPDFRMWILVFRPRLLRRICTDGRRRPLRALAPTGDFCRQLTLPHVRPLDRQFATLLTRCDDALRLNTGLADALLESWEAFLTADQPATSADLHPAVQRAARLLHETPDNTDLAALARQAGLSRTRLSELFHQQTGVALVDYRNRARLERFMSLHAATPPDRRKLLSLALEAGFGSYQQFYRVHRRHLGRNPAALP